MGVGEDKFVFIEMEPAGRSKAEQGTSGFEFITNTVGLSFSFHFDYNAVLSLCQASRAESSAS